MISHLLRFFCLLVCLTWSGCRAIIPQSNYTWGESYALDKNGGRCSIPEMNDGDLKTFGRLGIQAVGTLISAHNEKKLTAPGSMRGSARELSFTQVKVHPQVTVQFRQKQSIDKIVIHATNLNNFDIYWQDDQQAWHPLTSVRQNKKNPKNPIVVYAHAVTSTILINAKPQKPIPPSKTIIGTRQYVHQVQEAQIAEIEVYGKMVKGQLGN